jgi:hypothetical protein
MASGLKQIAGTIVKTDETLGLLFGYAIVCLKGGQPYIDLQNEHLPEKAMMKATTRYMQGERRAKLQHANGEQFDGRVIHSYPLTSEVAKALGITTEKTGWLVAIKPDNESTFLLAKAGVLTGFSIGGKYVVTTEVEIT